jgi:tight adherence protein C
MSVQPVIGAAMVATAIPIAWWAVSRPHPIGIGPGSPLHHAPNDLRALELGHGAGERVGMPMVAAVANLARHLSPAAAVADVESRLAAAGLDWPVERFLAAKVFLVAAGGSAGIVWFAAAPSALTLLLAIAVSALAWFAPDLVLKSRAQQRTDEIRRALPDTIDQVTIAVEAGLAFEAALAHVAANGSGPLAEELSRTLQDIQLGMPRSTALAGLASRADIPEMHRLVTAIQQSERYGVPIANVLRVQAGELRERRRQRAEEHAMKIPVKIVVPLVVCILPSLFVVIIGPAVIRFMESGFFD